MVGGGGCRKSRDEGTVKSLYDGIRARFVQGRMAHKGGVVFLDVMLCLGEAESTAYKTSIVGQCLR